ncbi:OLC1v1005149C1 [Oldenlandia corymbosa var. corymbosa]|uniref:OLC1v1005149C1 n=1 Tax=Oldenlandia corymbosa var. corymbosa TaxID=529605 RepID=A0AAV1DE13_OLDCO|nr:OLC1v1005149C1 [Oldenlandia corymbosa var. corymbosa]
MNVVDAILDGLLSVIPNNDDHYIDCDHIGGVCYHIEVGIKDDGRLKPKYGWRQARIKSTMKSKESRRYDGQVNEVDKKANKHVLAAFVKTHLAGEDGKTKIVIEDAQSEKKWSLVLDAEENLGKISGKAWKQLVQEMDIGMGQLCGLEWVKGTNLFFFHIL